MEEATIEKFDFCVSVCTVMFEYKGFQYFSETREGFYDSKAKANCIMASLHECLYTTFYSL